MKLSHTYHRGLNENVPHRLRYLHTWSQLVVLLGGLGGEHLLKEAHHWVWTMVSSLLSLLSA